jgi:hypothetical protein
MPICAPVVPVLTAEPLLPRLSSVPVYAQWDGVKLKVTIRRPSHAALAIRWQVFQRRRRAEVDVADEE